MLEAEFPVEADGDIVIGVDSQFQPFDIEPVVGSIDHGAEEDPSEAAAGEIVMHAHADAGDVLPAAGKTVEASIANDFAVLGDDEVERAGRRVFHVLANFLDPLVRRTQGASPVARQIYQIGDLLRIGQADGAHEDAIRQARSAAGFILFVFGHSCSPLVSGGEPALR